MVSALGTNFFFPPSNTNIDGRKKRAAKSQQSFSKGHWEGRVLWPNHWIPCLASIDYLFRLKIRTKLGSGDVRL